MCPVSIINSLLMILLFSNSAAHWHHLGSFDINGALVPRPDPLTGLVWRLCAECSLKLLCAATIGNTDPL